MLVGAKNQLTQKNTLQAVFNLILSLYSSFFFYRPRHRRNEMSLLQIFQLFYAFGTG